MPPGNQSEITFNGLKEFLVRIGFEPSFQSETSLAFQHPDSGTLILLSIPDDGQSVRPADLLSVLVRLECQGLVDDATIRQFRAGKLPLAS